MFFASLSDGILVTMQNNKEHHPRRQPHHLMNPALTNLLVTSGPQVVGVLIETFKLIRDNNPAAITEDQWKDLREMFAETYEERKTRIEHELKNSGMLS